MNTLRTTILLAVLTALLVWIGDMFGGRQGAIMALLIAGVMNFFSYWFSDKIVIKMYGGQEVTAQDDPERVIAARDRPETGTKGKSSRARNISRRL